MPDNTPQIVSITSESLQAKIRQLLPSQQGFGHDLQASNVILPIIDLTSSAEGSDVPVQLQEAFSFADVTNFEVKNTTTVLANSPGFYLLRGTISGITGTPARGAAIRMSDGLSSKDIYNINFANSSINASFAYEFTLRTFLRAGDSVSAFSDSTAVGISVGIRQIADVNGVLEQPTGFNPQ